MYFAAVQYTTADYCNFQIRKVLSLVKKSVWRRLNTWQNMQFNAISFHSDSLSEKWSCCIRAFKYSFWIMRQNMVLMTESWCWCKAFDVGVKHPSSTSMLSLVAVHQPQISVANITFWHIMMLVIDTSFQTKIIYCICIKMNLMSPT